MSRESNLQSTQNRIYLPTYELYKATTSGTGSGIAPAFNNVYDVLVDFTSTSVTGRGPSLVEFINQHGFYDANPTENPGNYLALFCSEAVLPGSTFETSEVRGLRQGIVSSNATFRRFPDISLTFYSQKDYYTQDVFNAWMEYISPTQLRNSTFGSSSRDRVNDRNSYRRLKYPKTYKCNIEITAFSNDVIPFNNKMKSIDSIRESARLSNSITYYLQNAFPTNIVAAPLAYGSAELIKTTVTFKYDCYYIDRTSLNINDGVVRRSDSEGNIRDPFL